MNPYGWFLLLTLAVGVAFEDARLLFFGAAWLVWAVERITSLGLAPLEAVGSRSRLRALVRGLGPPLAVVAVVVALGVPAARALFRERDRFAQRVAELPRASLRDGVFVGEGEGLRGPVRLAVEVREGKLRDVRILAAAETVSLGMNAIESLRARTLEEGRAPQALVTGATHASQGYRDAVNRALVESAFGPPEFPWTAEIFFYLTRNRLRFQLLNDVAAYLAAAGAIAAILAEGLRRAQNTA